MSDYTIKITVAPDGNIVSQVNGVKGKGCTDIARLVTQLGSVIEDKKTPEYYETDQTVHSATAQTQQTGQGGGRDER